MSVVAQRHTYRLPPKLKGTHQVADESPLSHYHLIALAHKGHAKQQNQLI